MSYSYIAGTRRSLQFGAPVATHTSLLERVRDCNVPMEPLLVFVVDP